MHFKVVLHSNVATAEFLAPHKKNNGRRSGNYSEFVDIPAEKIGMSPCLSCWFHKLTGGGAEGKRAILSGMLIWRREKNWQLQIPPAFACQTGTMLRKTSAETLLHETAAGP